MTAAIQDALRARAGELLSSGAVTMVIGWGQGRFEHQTTPLFVTTAEQASELVFDQYCVNTLAKYVIREVALAGEGKIAVCVRGCESRAINRMIADNQLNREQVHLIGIACPGMTDRQGQPLAKCEACTHADPLIYDELLGNLQPDATPSVGDVRFAEVLEMEGRSLEERREFFSAAYARCIRCYACREVCPCCTCRECFVDQLAQGWQGKQNSVAENRFYNLTRLFHVGDRCIECGECERACPSNLPLMLLNRKMIKDLDVLFATGEAGLAEHGQPALTSYDLSDREEFM